MAFWEAGCLAVRFLRNVSFRRLTTGAAGGYDAIWVLCVDDPAVITTVEDVWASWTEMSVSPLSARQSDGGLQAEEEGAVRGLTDALKRARV